MKIYLYIQDGGDGSYSVSWYKSEEDRQKHAAYDEKLMGYTVDGACDYTIDTDNISFDEPPDISELDDESDDEESSFEDEWTRDPR